MSKICEKNGCDNVIPSKFGEKYINIQRRRFCFVCSPFGAKNTRDLNYTPIYTPRKTSYDKVKKYRQNKKKKCIEYKGGKCIVCGYNKYEGAMDFHHLDPSKKDFTISHKYHINFEDTKIELDKCVLLCNRCHQEVHAEIIDLKEYIFDNR